MGRHGRRGKRVGGRHETLKDFLGFSPPPAKKEAVSPQQGRKEQPRREVVSITSPLSVASSHGEETVGAAPAEAAAKEDRAPKTKNQGKEKSIKRKNTKI